MADRVDKKWQQQGLSKYSTEAILGTLAHYGAPVTEEDFKKQADAAYPLELAQRWHEGWKGTGQFASYPFAAAQELWKRWLKDRSLPSDLGEVVGKVLVALSKRLAGQKDAQVAEAFQAAAELKPKIPVKDGGADERYAEEAFALLGEDLMKTFDEMAERLAKEGHVDEARQFAELEEFIIPARAGVVTSIVKAAAGERDQALAELEKVASDGARDGYSRLSAVDALIHLGSDKARPLAEALLEDAEKKEDHHLAMEVVQRLLHLLEQTSDAAAMRSLAERAQRIHDAHDKAHPHHRH